MDSIFHPAKLCAKSNWIPVNGKETHPIRTALNSAASAVPNSRREGGRSSPCARRQAGTEFKSVVTVQ